MRDVRCAIRPCGGAPHTRFAPVLFGWPCSLFRCGHTHAAAAAYAAAARSHVIDYIFHTAQLKCTDVLGPPAAADLEPTRLPGMRAPSDHLPIAAKFVILSPRWAPCC